jgi:hypothetical protein
MSMEKSNETIGNRTRDLPACSAVPQPNACPLKFREIPLVASTGPSILGGCTITHKRLLILVELRHQKRPLYVSGLYESRMKSSGSPILFLMKDGLHRGEKRRSRFGFRT